MGIEWTSCSLGGAAAGATGPPDFADSKRDHPSRLCLDHVRLPSKWRRRRRQEDYPSDFLNLGRGCSLSSFLEADGRAAAEAGEPSCLRESNGNSLCLLCSCLGDRLRAGSFLSLFFLGLFCTKTGAGMRNAYSTLAFA